MLEGHHYQNAYVTRDIDKAIATFRERATVRELLRSEHEFEVRTPTGTGPALNKLAFIWVDNLQYELIEPVSGLVDLYRDALPDDDRPRFHHICARIDDWGDFRARVDRQDLPVVYEGGGSALRFLYLDARPFLGHYLEYIWMTPERWTRMSGR